MKIKTIVLPKRSDRRGWLIENIDPKVRRLMKHFLVSTSKPGAIRGQHYHQKKLEWFMVVKGQAKLYFEDIKSKERAEIKLSDRKFEMAEVPPMVAHAIKNVGKSTLYLIAIVNEHLKPKKPDTFAYKVK